MGCLTCGQFMDLNTHSDITCLSRKFNRKINLMILIYRFHAATLA